VEKGVKKNRGSQESGRRKTPKEEVVVGWKGPPNPQQKNLFFREETANRRRKERYNKKKMWGSHIRKNPLYRAPERITLKQQIRKDMQANEKGAESNGK